MVRFNADFHVHSKYSRATSSACDLEHLSLWGRRKGLTVVGTGDFTHPGWLDELEHKLAPAEEGLYVLREAGLETRNGEFVPADPAGACGAAPDVADRQVRFLATVEISSIYKRGGRVRKVHNVIFAPDLAAARRIFARLDAIGNVRSDGRPILGLDSRDLLKIVLECSDGAFIVPAHVWTPHFSALGAHSGFDSLEECFGDLTDRIFAVETGLSSDPPMNWRLSALDGLALISCSDAHSPAKLGREATMFDTELSFPAIRRALEQRAGLVGTIEFFPEEGKYHLDGHRACGRRMTPAESRAAGGRCPECGRKITLGVLHRVEQLADRVQGFRPAGSASFVNLIPLQEILGEILQVGPASKAVFKAYSSLLLRLGPELHILKDAPLDVLEDAGPPLLRTAIDRMRRGEVHVQAGYDGEYGVVSVFRREELEAAGSRAQKTLF